MTTRTDFTRNSRFWHLDRNFTVGVAMLASMFVASTGMAYERYNDGCVDCHGSFTGSTSTKGSVFPSGNKHEMHRGSSYMDTACSLCHTSGDQRNPYIGSSDGTSNNPGLGCTGCHQTAGLRRHHLNNGVVDQYGDDCAMCHSVGTPSEENVNPPYYGTPDTRANNSGNGALVSNTNENWTVGDFVGLDNDGDNLYDQADYSCGPLQVVEVVPDGSNMRVRWETAGGRKEQIQATSILTNGFSSVGTAFTIPGVGVVTQEVVDVNGALNSQGYYRVRGNL